MVTLGANVAIFDENTVLLILREDFEVWCLPGGHLDPGETFAQAAIREAHEETGLEVELTRFVGSYTRPNWRDSFYHIHLFAAKAVGGVLTPQPEEVLELRYFPVDDLPEALLVGQRQRVLDAARGLTGVVKRENATWPFAGLSRLEVYQLKDESGLAPAEFYRQHFPPLTPDQIITEVAGHVINATDENAPL